MSSNSSSSSSSSRLNNSNHCQVILRNYISEGGFKYVSKGYYDEGQRKGQACVGKIYKTGSVYIDKPFEKELLTSEQSLTLIHAFNKAGFIDKIVRLNKPEIWRKDYPPHEKHLTEPFIEIFERFNSNSGWYNKTEGWPQIMQALSHFSYHFSDGNLLLCDLQGGIAQDHIILTDPVILSKERKFGPADLGKNGILTFFQRHVCNKYCRKHWLRPSLDESDWELIDEKEGTSIADEYAHINTDTSKPQYTKQNI